MNRPKRGLGDKKCFIFDVLGTLRSLSARIFRKLVKAHNPPTKNTLGMTFEDRLEIEDKIAF